MKFIKLLALLMSLISLSLLMTACGGDDDGDDGDDGGNGDATLYEYNADSTVVTVTDFGQGTGTMTWSADKTWVLTNFVFVNDGQTLTIEPGTVVKGKPSQGEQASALIVARGGMIMAEGTADAPIIFTAEADNVNDPNEAVDTQRGRWGGVILLGRATQNTDPSEQAIEGIPTTESRGVYGGDNDADNSGVLRYVSIRHGGTDIGAGNEINGLSLGCVGSGTTIEHIEVVYNKDDGIEFYGGTVNVKHAVVAFVGDDSFDYDQGYRGKIQHALVIQGDGDGEGDRGGEFDGGTSPEDGQPYATPTFWNATFIGGGQDSTSRRAATLRDNAGGYFNNCYFTQFGRGIDVEDLGPEKGSDSYERLGAGQLAFSNNRFFAIGDNAPETMLYKVEPDADNATTPLTDHFNSNGNQVADLGLQISYEQNNGLNLIPSNMATGGTPPADGFFDPSATHIGAFGSNNWLAGWSFLSTHNYLAN